MLDIVHRVGIRAPASKVFDAVTTTEGVGGWWTRSTTGTAEIGGKVNVRFLRDDGEEIGQMDFEMTTQVPNREVQWRILAGPPEWIGTDITFHFEEDGDMTILIFGHRGWKEPVEFMAHCSMKWAVFMLSLRDMLETGEGRPSPDDMKIDNWN
ncbi:MAG: SRPBCC domain-containing protein [Gemmatimonadales bacterium]|nr:SRPBCC domain-containing protein [Gemmatimonadales bacterium]